MTAKTHLVFQFLVHILILCSQHWFTVYTTLTHLNRRKTYSDSSFYSQLTTHTHVAQISHHKHFQIFTCCIYSAYQKKKKLSNFHNIWDCCPFHSSLSSLQLWLRSYLRRTTYCGRKLQVLFSNMLCALSSGNFLQRPCNVARTRCGKMRVIASKIVRLRTCVFVYIIAVGRCVSVGALHTVWILLSCMEESSSMLLCVKCWLHHD